MQNHTFHMTQLRHDELTQELEERKSTIRMNIGEVLSAAKALGDLSENAEYHTARDKQGKNESRIREIEHLLQHAVIVTKTTGDTVQLASTVTLQKKGGAEPATYTIVGPAEADMSAGKLSSESPLGRVLLGASKGSSVTATTPKGEIEYTIKDIT